MHLIYVDDSGDDQLSIFSALAVPIDQWRACFQAVRDFRRQLKATYGIFVYKELHAWEFVSGRGRISAQIVTKSQRCRIFRQALQLTASLPGAHLFNACFPKAAKVRAFERTVNCVNRTLESWASYAVLISDKGNEIAYTRLLRRMNVFNPIPSAYGVWADTGERFRNIPITRIIEDPFFKDSRQSYFLQLVDFAAYSLLRREHPLASKNKYGLNTAFPILQPILVIEANRRDPEGVIRP
jgi:hypothetical protein